MPKNTATPEVPETTESDAARDEATTGTVSVEHNGHTYVVDPESNNDVELMDALAEFGSGNSLVLPRIVRGLLGSEQYDEFLEVNRDPATGRVPKPALYSLFHLVDAALGE